MKTIGVVLLVLGIVALVYDGISYSRNRTILQMGSMEIAATEHRSIPIPAVAGVVAVLGGVALMFVGRRSGNA